MPPYLSFQLQNNILTFALSYILTFRIPSPIKNSTFKIKHPRVSARERVPGMRGRLDAARLVGRIIRDPPIESLKPKSLYRPMQTIGPTTNHSTGRDDHPRSS